MPFCGELAQLGRDQPWARATTKPGPAARATPRAAPSMPPRPATEQPIDAVRPAIVAAETRNAGLQRHRPAPAVSASPVATPTARHRATRVGPAGHTPLAQP